jgi:hypothetical protein
LLLCIGGSLQQQLKKKLFSVSNPLFIFATVAITALATLRRDFIAFFNVLTTVKEAVNPLLQTSQDTFSVTQHLPSNTQLYTRALYGLPPFLAIYGKPLIAFLKSL